MQPSPGPPQDRHGTLLAKAIRQPKQGLQTRPSTLVLQYKEMYVESRATLNLIRTLLATDYTDWTDIDGSIRGNLYNLWLEIELHGSGGIEAARLPAPRRTPWR